LLAVIQIALGLVSVTTFLDTVPVTAHLAVAAAILGDCVWLWLYARGRVAASSALLITSTSASTSTLTVSA
jgi:hypothetical protein